MLDQDLTLGSYEPFLVQSKGRLKGAVETLFGRAEGFSKSPVPEIFPWCLQNLFVHMLVLGGTCTRHSLIETSRGSTGVSAPKDRGVHKRLGLESSHPFAEAAPTNR